uniref:Transcriptional regulator n=2 Tax=environmental samples TaxID=651140 RepID=A0A075FVH1_9ARCH|nr:hypothetical protein [uncultured marine thaumarchaeote AD1000_05_B01]AIE95353.1 hypothetical protein [uncultured marine thaumarchaeote AD1000_65_A02]
MGGFTEMSSRLTSEVKLRLLYGLAEQSGRWVTESHLAKITRSKEDRIKPVVDMFEKRGVIKSLNWQELPVNQQKEITKSQTIASTTKRLYQIEMEGWKKLKQILKPCFEHENVLDILNIPDEMRKKFKD